MESIFVSHANVSARAIPGSGQFIQAFQALLWRGGNALSLRAYSLPSLLPGPYKLSAELNGFQSQSYIDVRLGNAEQIRLNFTLRVGGANTAVEVSIPIDSTLAVSSSSVGEVINQQRVVSLNFTPSFPIVKTYPSISFVSR
jgi:hypothetical protein